MQKARILLVEDELIVAAELAERLRNVGHEVVALSSTGMSAIASAARHRPDIVLMDIRLKGSMDGIEAARRIRADWGTPVVFTTAHADEATLQRAREVRPSGLVMKPFADGQLEVAIEIAMRIRSINGPDETSLPNDTIS